MSRPRKRFQYPEKLDNKLDVDGNSDTKFLIIEPYKVEPGDIDISEVDGTTVGKIGKSEPKPFPFYLVLPAKPVTVDLAHNWSEGDFIPDIKSVQEGGSLGKTIYNTVSGGLQRKGTQRLIDLANTLTGGAANTILQHANKGSFQPKRMFYGGTQPFGFSFSWRMSPRSRSEAQTIKTIVDLFKYYTTAQDPSSSEANELLVTQPPYWKITYVNGEPGVEEGFQVLGAENGDLVKNLFFNKNEMDDLVCTNVSVDYSEGEIYTTFPDNFPNVITLKVNFKMAQNVKSAEKLFGKINEDLRLEEVKKENENGGT